MPANTTCMNFPYPLDSDRIDVALHIKQLAQAVDAAVCGQQIPDLDARFVNRTGDTMTGMLTLPGTNPTSDNHAVRKRWVDDNFVHVIGDTLTGPLIYANSVTDAELDGPNMITRRSWQVATFIDKTGDTMTGNLVMGGNPQADINMGGGLITNMASVNAITNAGPATAISKEYLNSRLGDYVEIAGDRMTGALGVGTAPNSGNGWTIDDQGTAAAAHNSNAVQLALRKGPSADAAGQVYIRFEHGSAPGTLVGDLHMGTGQDRIVLQNGVVNAPSDYRLKEPLGPMDSALARVRALAAKAYRGRWRASGLEAEFVNAHDVAAVAPYAVYGDKDGDATQCVDYDSLTPLLLAAIGELAEMVEAA